MRKIGILVIAVAAFIGAAYYARADFPDYNVRNLIMTGYLSETCAGTVTLAAGTGTVTLSANCAAGAGPLYLCTDQTAAAACKTGVSGTTLTVTGTGTDVVGYGRVL